MNTYLQNKGWLSQKYCDEWMSSDEVAVKIGKPKYKLNFPEEVV